MTKEVIRPFTILVPLDGSELAASALPVAKELAQRLQGQVALMQVLPMMLEPLGITPGYVEPETYQRIYDEQEQWARANLETAAASLRASGLTVHAYIQRGDPAASLIDAITDLGIGLVVMTSHGRTGLSRFALGSVADRVVRSAVAPLLLLRSFAPGSAASARPLTFNHALAPLDGSALGEYALYTIGLRLAGSVISEFTLVEVVDPRDDGAGEIAANSYLEDERSRLLERLKDRHVTIKTAAPMGEPAAGILDTARAQSADLILMSTRGQAGIGRLTFGSVADRVVRDGDLPILFVHPPKN